MTPSLAAEGWQLDATALPPVPRTYVQQNFTSLYAIDTEGAPGNDLAFRLHANGLCGERRTAAAAAAAAAVGCFCSVAFRHERIQSRTNSVHPPRRSCDTGAIACGARQPRRAGSCGRPGRHTWPAGGSQQCRRQ